MAERGLTCSQSVMNQVDIFLDEWTGLAAHFEVVTIVPSSFHDASSRMPGDTFKDMCDLVNQYMGHHGWTPIGIHLLHAVGERNDGPHVGSSTDHSRLRLISSCSRRGLACIGCGFRTDWFSRTRT